MPLTYGRSFAGINQTQQIRTELLVAQKEVIEEIAKTGRDCVIVGQNADVLLRGHLIISAGLIRTVPEQGNFSEEAGGGTGGNTILQLTQTSGR